MSRHAAGDAENTPAPQKLHPTAPQTLRKGAKNSAEALKKLSRSAEKTPLRRTTFSADAPNKVKISLKFVKISMEFLKISVEFLKISMIF